MGHRCGNGQAAPLVAIDLPSLEREDLGRRWRENLSEPAIPRLQGHTLLRIELVALIHEPADLRYTYVYGIS